MTLYKRRKLRQHLPERFVQNLGPDKTLIRAHFNYLRRDSATFIGYVDTLSQIPAAQRTGTDPLTMALAVVAPNAGRPLDIEVLPNGPSAEVPSRVIVTIDQSGLLDDSVAAFRDRFDIAAQEGQWAVVTAGRQFCCQPGCGHQDWSADLCS